MSLAPGYVPALPFAATCCLFFWIISSSIAEHQSLRCMLDNTTYLLIFLLITAVHSFGDITGYCQDWAVPLTAIPSINCRLPDRCYSSTRLQTFLICTEHHSIETGHCGTVWIDFVFTHDFCIVNSLIALIFLALADDDKHCANIPEIFT